MAEDGSALTCPYRKLHPAVLMMKTAKDRPSGKLAIPLDRPMAWRILIQGQRRSEFVVIAGVGRKDPAQMGFAEDHDVIEAFAADGADQSLRMPVLPGRSWGRRVITDAHRRKTPGDGVPVGPVAVADEIIRRLVPGERIGDLAGDPLRRRIGRHAERD